MWAGGFRDAQWLGPSLVAQMVKRLSTMRETGVQSLGQEDPLEKEMAIHSSTIAWKFCTLEFCTKVKLSIKCGDT